MKPHNIFGIATVLLLSSVIAGELWDKLGAATTFHAGAVFCIATIVLLVAGKAPDTRAGTR